MSLKAWAYLDREAYSAKMPVFDVGQLEIELGRQYARNLQCDETVESGGLTDKRTQGD